MIKQVYVCLDCGEYFEDDRPEVCSCGCKEIEIAEYLEKNDGP